MQSKTPFNLILVGFILDLVGTAWSLSNIFYITKLGPKLFESFNKFFGAGTLSLYDMAMQKAIILSASGIILSLVMFFIVVRLYKKPTKKIFIATIVFGVIGLVTGHLGGVLELIGGIMGLNKINKG